MANGTNYFDSHVNVKEFSSHKNDLDGEKGNDIGAQDRVWSGCGASAQLDY